MFFLLSVLLLSSVQASLGAVGGLTTISALDTTYVTPVGRTYTASGGLAFSYLGGGLRVSHTGKTLRATLLGLQKGYKMAYYQTNEGYTPFQGIAWVPGTGVNETITIGASASGGILLVLNDPPQYFQGPGESAVVLSLTSDGDFIPATPPATPARVLHVLGDSITASTNIRGGVPHCADGGFQADYSSSWAGILCPFYGASCSTIAVGGKGLVRNCCDNDQRLSEYYTTARFGDADGTWGFKDAVPQGVLIYCGTNDFDQGESAALDAAYTAGLLAFMTNVTQHHYGTPASPANITFFAVLGPMSPTAPVNATLAAIEQSNALGFRLILINATTACSVDGLSVVGCTDGCATHPGLSSHRNIARAAAPIIEAALGWPSPGQL